VPHCPPVVYKAIVGKQVVVYQERYSTISGPPRRLDDCIVRDTHNWDCSSPDKTMMMIDGELTEYPDPGTVQVSMVTWRVLNHGGRIADLLRGKHWK
jgi:hypothetical protein